MTMSLSRQFPVNLYLGFTPYTMQQPWPNRRLYPKRLKRFARAKRQNSRLLGKSIQKRMLLETVICNNKKITKMSIQAMHNLWARRFWFLHNALPLAVQLKPIKPNVLFKMHLNAILPLSVWLGQKGIQFLRKVATTSLYFSFKNKQENTWNFIQALESYSPITITRLSFTSRPSEGKFWVKHHEVRKNGFILKSGWNPLMPADFVQNQKKIFDFWSQKLNQVHFDSPKSIFKFSIKQFKQKIY